MSSVEINMPSPAEFSDPAASLPAEEIKDEAKPEVESVPAVLGEVSNTVANATNNTTSAVIKTPLLVQKRRRVSELADPTPSKMQKTAPTLAESIKKFQSRTPPRFRTKSAKENVAPPRSTTANPAKKTVLPAPKGVAPCMRGGSFRTFSTFSIPAATEVKSSGSAQPPAKQPSERAALTPSRRNATVVVPFKLSVSNYHRSASASTTSGGMLTGSSPTISGTSSTLPAKPKQKTQAGGSSFKPVISEPNKKILVKLKGTYGVARPFKKPATQFKEFKLHTNMRAEQRRTPGSDFKKSSPAKKVAKPSKK